MPAPAAILGLVLAASVAMAQTEPQRRMRALEDQLWATKTGLSVADAKTLRTMAGIADDAPDGRVGSVDAASLARRGHILLTEAGNGHCMRVHVFVRDQDSFREVWLLTETPRPSGSRFPMAKSPAGGICSQGPRQPSAHGTEDGKIVVEVPVMSDAFQRTVPAEEFVYTWDGKTYVLSSSKL